MHLLQEVLETFIEQKLQHLPLTEQSEENVFREYVEYVFSKCIHLFTECYPLTFTEFLLSIKSMW